MTVAALSQNLQMHPPRLSRLENVFPGYSIYFVTFCTYRRASLLNNPSVHESFRTFCLTAKDHTVVVGRYLLMPDHLHFFVDTGDEVLLSDWMKSLKNSLSKTLRKHHHASPHWQKGFFDYLVRSENSYQEKWLYVRENPVRAKLVSVPDDWPYQGEIESLPFS